MPEKLLTSAETAELLRIPVRTLYQWTRRGDGPQGRKFGVRVLYREAEVQAFIDSRWADES